MKRVLVVVVMASFFFTSYLSITGCASAVFLGAKAVQITNNGDKDKKDDSSKPKHFDAGRQRWVK